MVGGQLICSTSRHDKSHRNLYDAWKRHHVHCIMYTKIKYKKFNGGRTSGCGQCNGPSTMDKAFPSSTSTTHTNNNNLPGQQKYNPTSRKQKILEFKENPTHQHTKLLYLLHRTRQDIQMAVAFLCTRVQFPDNRGCQFISKRSS